VLTKHHAAIIEPCKIEKNCHKDSCYREKKENNSANNNQDIVTVNVIIIIVISVSISFIAMFTII